MRRFLLSGVLILLAASVPLAEENKKPTKFMVYIGTYTGGAGKSEGIYRAELDLATGKLSEPSVAAKTRSPSFVAIHPTGKYLYAVGEESTVKGKRAGGAVVAFAIDQKTGDLKRLNAHSSGGSGPCHVVVDKSGKYVLAANYGGGSCCALPIGKDGKVGEATGFVQHKGKSIDKGRQMHPHAHSINMDPANKFAFCADLGLDKVLIYKLDPEKGTLTANDPAHATVKGGSGPRHFAFHPTGKYAYVINEMAMTVTAFSYDASKGELKEIQTITTIPKVKSIKGFSTAEVVVHPSGKFLYGSNRGHNTIAIYSIDQKTGKLTAVGHQGKGIKTPRNFAIEPTGKWLLAASQDGHEVLVFEIDQKTGNLKPTEHKIKVGSPVCVRFLAWPR